MLIIYNEPGATPLCRTCKPRKSIENLLKIYRKSIENLSNIYRKSIENLWTHPPPLLLQASLYRIRVRVRFIIYNEPWGCTCTSVTYGTLFIIYNEPGPIPLYRLCGWGLHSLHILYQVMYLYTDYIRDSIHNLSLIHISEPTRP